MDRIQARQLAEKALSELTLYDDYAFVHGAVLTGCNGSGYWVSDRFDKIENLSKTETIEQITILLTTPAPTEYACIQGGEWVES